MKKTLLIFASFVSITVYSQDKIETERPGETVSPKTLPKNCFQAELGFRRTQENEQDRTWRTPNGLFRFGLLEKLELRLETSVENEKMVSENKFKRGVKPVELGLKLNLFSTKKETFSSSIVGQAGIPKLASADHQPDKSYHRVRLLFENKLSDKVNLNYNIGSDWDSDDEEQNWVYSFDSEFKLTDKWESFAEVFGFAKKGKTPEDVFDAGFAYFVSKNTKVDLSGGVGLNDESRHYFVAAGFSFRVGGKR